MSAAVLLAGAFGQGNPGDDALLAAFAAALPDHRLVVPVRGPGRAAIAELAPDLAAPTTSSGAGSRLGRAATRRVGALEMIPARAGAVLAAVRRVDAVVLAGGTTFKVLERSTGRPALALLAQANALATGAQLGGRPVAALGVGAGRLDRPGARRLARRLVGRLDLLVLRDEASAEVLDAAGVPSPIRVGADPAWTLFAEPLGPGPHEAPRPDAAAGPVHVALSHHAAVDPATLAEALTVAVERGHHLVLEPWQRDEAGFDAALAGAVAARLPMRTATVLVDGPGDLLAAAERYRQAAAVVGLRFHALVAAAAAGARFLAVDHEPKLAAVARRTGQRSVPAHAPAGVLRRSLALALDGPPPSPDAVRAEVAKADAGFELLRLLLSGGRDVDIDTVDGLDLVGGGRTW